MPEVIHIQNPSGPHRRAGLQGSALPLGADPARALSLSGHTAGVRVLGARASPASIAAIPQGSEPGRRSPLRDVWEPHATTAAADPGEASLQRALRTQRHLAGARRALGQAQGASQETAALERKVASLEREQAAQLSLAPLDTERALGVAFVEGFEALEREHGTSKAVTLARNTYYTGPIWSRASGAPELSLAEINALGLPRTAQHSEFHNHGFVLLARHPDGRRIDVGHVLCAIDFSMHDARRPRLFADPDSKVIAPNVFDAETTTLIGDLASAVVYRGRNPEKTADASLLEYENNSDLRGDLLGLVLAEEIRRARKVDPDALVGPIVRRALLEPRSPEALMRAFAKDHPSWVKVKEREGAAPVFEARFGGLFPKTWLMTLLTEKGRSALRSARDARPIFEAFARWMGAEAAGLHPPGDYPVPLSGYPG